MSHNALTVNSKSTVNLSDLIGAAQDGQCVSALNNTMAPRAIPAAQAEYAGAITNFTATPAWTHPSASSSYGNTSALTYRWINYSGTSLQPNRSDRVFNAAFTISPPPNTWYSIGATAPKSGYYLISCTLTANVTGWLRWGIQQARGVLGGPCIILVAGNNNRYSGTIRRVVYHTQGQAFSYAPFCTAYTLLTNRPSSNPRHACFSFMITYIG